MVETLGGRERRRSNWSWSDISGSDRVESIPTKDIGAKLAKSDSIHGHVDENHPAKKSDISGYHPSANFITDKNRKHRWPRNWLHVILDHLAGIEGIPFSTARTRLNAAMGWGGRRTGTVYNILDGVRGNIKAEETKGITRLTGFSADQIASMDVDWKNGRDFIGTYAELIKKYGEPGKTAVYAEDHHGPVERKPHQIVTFEDIAVIFLPAFNMTLDMPDGRYDDNTWKPHFLRYVSLTFLKDELRANPKKVIILTDAWKASGEPKIGHSDRIYVDTSRDDMDQVELVFRLEDDGPVYIRDAKLSDDGETVNLTAKADPSKVKWWLDIPVTQVIPIGVVIDRSHPILPS